MKVKASNTRSVPNQTNFVRCTSSVGRRESASARRARLLIPSAATIRSASPSSDSSPTSRWKTRPPILTSGPVSREDVGQPGALREVGNGGEQHQFVAPGLLVSANELLLRLGGGEVRRGDLVGERPGERVVVPQVLGAAFCRASAEREVALPPHLGAVGPAHLGPRGPRLRRRGGEGPRWAASVHVAVGPPSHPGEGLAAQPPNQERRAPAAATGARSPLLPVRPHRQELIREPLAPIAVLDPGDRI